MKKIMIFLSAAVLFSGCTHKQQSAVKEQPVNINTVAVSDTAYIPEIEYTGTLMASQEANLGSIVPGRVERILIPEGGYVQEGGLIVEMADELLAQAKVEFQTLQKDMQRMENLLAQNTVSRQEYDHVKAQFDASQAKYALLKKNTEIRAPFSGTVVKHCVKQGENYNFLPNINPGYSLNSGIVSLMKLNPLLVKVEVNEQNLKQVKLGQTVEIALPMLDNLARSGKVTKIMPILSQITRTATVEISLNNPGNTLKPGMFCKASFHLPAEQALVIPRESLLRTSGTAETYVYTIKGNIATRKNVTILGEFSSCFVVQGLEADDKVVTEGKSKLNQGTKVNVIG